MAYAKQHFADGQTLTAAQLNHIEDGLAAIEEELLDICVGIDETFETPGDAVREQFRQALGYAQAAETEIANARWSADGTPHESLQERLNDLEMRIGGTIIPATIE